MWSRAMETTSSEPGGHVLAPKGKEDMIGPDHLLCARHFPVIPSFPQPRGLSSERWGHLKETDTARRNWWDSTWRCPMSASLCFPPSFLPSLSLGHCICSCLSLLPVVSFRKRLRERHWGLRLREQLEEAGSSRRAFPCRPLGDHEDACR